MKASIIVFLAITVWGMLIITTTINVVMNLSLVLWGIANIVFVIFLGKQKEGKI